MKFSEFLDSKDEGFLNQAWGAMKGAYQGAANAWQMGKFNQNQYTPQQIDVIKIGNTASNLYPMIQQVKDPTLQKQLLAIYSQFNKGMDGLRNQYFNQHQSQ